MNELKAYEIRWFGAGPLPQDVTDVFDAFSHDPPLCAREDRTDLYVVITGQEGIGIKLRGIEDSSDEGKFEIKLRTAIAESPTTVQGASGVAEHWHKVRWNYEKEQDPIVNAFVRQALGGEVVEVHKNRFQWMLDPDASELTPLRFDGEPPPRACLLERTSVTLNDNFYWSVAMDAFDDNGGEAEKLEVLKKGLALCLARYSGDTLAVTNSFGYPRYLLNHL